MEGIAADRAVGRLQERAKGRMAQFDPLAPLVGDRAELHVGIQELAQDTSTALGRLIKKD